MTPHKRRCPLFGAMVLCLAFGTFPMLGANLPPTISAIATQTIDEDAATGPIGITVNDPDGDAAALVLSKSSSNSTLLPAANIIIGGSGMNRTLTLTPATNQFGSAIVTLTVSDGTDTATNAFTLTVRSLNDAPSFAKGADQSVLEDAPAQSIPGWATQISRGSANESGQTLSFLVSTDNNALFASLPAVSPTGTLTFRPALNIYGLANVSVHLKDNGTANAGEANTSSAQSFVITVLSVNDTPTFSLLTNVVRVLEDAPLQSLPNFARSISRGPGNEAGQTLTFVVTNNQPAFYSVQPAISASAMLTYRPAPNVHGTNIVTVSLRDNGGTSNGAQDTSTITFHVVVTKIDEAPVISALAARTLLEDRSTNLTFTVSDEDGSVTNVVVSSSNTDLVDAAGLVLSLTNLNTGLVGAGIVINPKANAHGTAQISVVAADDQGSRRTNGFGLTVTAVNDAPGFDLPTNVVTVLEDAALQNLDNFMANLSRGAANETNQTLTIVVTNSASAFYAVQPAINASGTLSFRPATDGHGTNVLQILVRDNGGVANGGSDTSVTNTVSIVVQSVNDAPEFDLATNVVQVAEDASARTFANFARNLSRGAANEAEQTLAFVVTHDNPAFYAQQPAINGLGTLGFHVAANVYGTNTVWVYLEDNGGTVNGGVERSGTNTFMVVVNRVNELPTISVSPQMLDEDGSSNPSFPVNDPDGSVTNVTGRSSNQGLVTDGSLVTVLDVGLVNVALTPVPNANGTASISLIATDDEGGRSTNHFVLTVNPVNDAPGFGLSTNVIVVAENAGTTTVTNFAVQLQKGPPNESAQTLIFTVASDSPAFFTTPPAISSNGALGFQVAPNVNGTNSITVFLRDNGGTDIGGVDTSTATNFSIVATSVNTPPVLSAPADRTINEDQPASVNFNVMDLDGTIVSVSGVSANQSLVPNGNLIVTGDGANKTLMITPAADASGAVVIAIIATDDFGARTTNRFALTVNSANDPPTFLLATNLVRVTEDSAALSFTNFLTNLSRGPANESGQTASIVVKTANPAFYVVVPAISPTGTLGFRPAANVHGTDLLQVYARDNGGVANSGRDISTTNIVSIVVTPSNDPPVISTLAARTVLEDRSTNLIFTIRDLDGAITNVAMTSSNPALVDGSGLTLLLTNLNSGHVTGRLIISPLANGNGTANILMVASDDAGGTATNKFVFTVTPVNDAPGFLLSTNLITVAEDAPLTQITNFAANLSKGAANEAGQTLTFFVATSSNAFFTSLPLITPNGNLTFRPAPDAHGTVLVSVYAKDNGGIVNGGVDRSTNAQFNVEVLPVADAPKMTGLGPRTINEDTPVNIPFNVSNLDGSAGEVSVTASSSNSNVVANAGLFVTGVGSARFLALSPVSNAFGATTITLVAEDAVLGRSTNSFLLTVSPVNDSPGFVLSRTSIAVTRNAATTNVPNWAINLSKGPTNESVQTLSFSVTNNNGALFSTQPAISPTGVLTFDPAANVSGMATVSALIRDTGGILNGGINQSSARVFTILVMAVPLAAGDLIVAERGVLGSPGAIILVRTNNGAQTLLATNLLDPYGIALAPNGDLIVADIDDAANDPVNKLGAIYRIDRLTLNRSIISSSNIFVEPFDVAVETGGSILVADALAVTSPGVAGAVIRVSTSGIQTVLSAGFSTLSGLALAANGNIYVSEIGDGGADLPKVIQVNQVDGSQTVVSEGGQLERPMGLAVDPGSGDVMVLDQGTTKKLVRLHFAGPDWLQSVVNTGGLLEGPSHLAIDAQGDFFITDESAIGSSIILRVKSDGTLKTVISEGGHLDSPRGIIVVP